MSAFLSAQAILLTITVIVLWRRVAWLEVMVTRNSQGSVTGVADINDFAPRYGRMENGNLVVDEASMRQARGKVGEA